MGRKHRKVTGACLCGQVEFTVELPAKWCAHCHCTRCQRSHGAGFVTWFGVNKEHLTLEKGEKLLRWVSASKKSEYGFCGHCGSSMLFRSTKWLDEIHITLANVHNDIGLKPQAHVYFDTHVDWLNFEDTLERHVDPDVK
ncbi:MAG TPA: GFA family protein [Candidatus Marinimicrobia bacterium]|jgi:hypothetical protein|nr:GFA family protein [Candidatus Neomarinimicrobiota bacterium]|tara:strand:- start:363 stop:782 length:420 start_codon:yes stop_codon:yes gene_type:complete